MANQFVTIDSGENAGFTASDNVYCAANAADVRFTLGKSMTFDEWTAATGTDKSSTPLALSDARCSGW